MKNAAERTAEMRTYRSRVRPPERLRYRAANDVPTPLGEEIRTRDGRILRLRAIHSDDVAALQRGFARLSPEEIRMRFLHMLTELPDALAGRLCNLDPDQEIAFVLADPSGTPDPEIHAVARVYIDPSTNSAEYALVVQKALTGQGLGLLLMRHLLDACRARGVHEIWGDVLTENHAMLRLCDRLRFKRDSVFHDPTLTRVRLALS